MELGAINAGNHIGINKHLYDISKDPGSFKAIFKGAIKGLNNAGDKPDKEVNKGLMDVCYEFEAILVNRVLKVMRDSVETKSSLLYGGYAEDVFKDMLYDKHSVNLAKSEGFGLAKEIYNQLVSSNSDIKI